MTWKIDLPDRKPAYFEEAQIRITDIDVFLRAYRIANEAPLAQRDTYAKLLSPLGLYTTVVGQLERVVRYFFDKESLDTLKRESEISLLFQKTDGGLRPTSRALVLYKRLELVSDVYGLARDAVWEETHPSSLPRVRLGTVETIGLHLLSNIFSCWPERFAREMALNVEIENSRNLIPRLHSGLLDFVIGYGPVSGHLDQLGTLCVHFQPLGLDPIASDNPERAINPRLILASHKHMRPTLLPGFKEKPQRVKKAMEKAGRNSLHELHDALPEIVLEHIDPIQTQLIVVPSFFQPARLLSFIRTHRELIREVASYDEALALVRMGQGAAVLTEVFLFRGGVQPYRFASSDDFRRSIGVYYNPRQGVSDEAHRLIRLIDLFLWECRMVLMYQGRMPALEHPELKKEYKRVLEIFNNPDHVGPVYLHKLKSR